MIFSTSKLLSPLSKALNHSTGEFSTHSTGFNNSLWGNQTRGLIKLINKKLRLESYDKIVAGAQDITKKNCGPIRAEEIIDLTADEPPDEFVMLVDIPSNDDDDDSKIAIIKSDCVGCETHPVNNINNKQVVKVGGDESGYEYEYEASEVLDDDEQLEYISKSS